MSFLKEKGLLTILVILLAVYLAAICVVNFCAYPTWYDSDMYQDILYASKAWKEKSLFPENWVFGNQYYVVSTPVIAALFCSVFEPQVAMAAASSLVSVWIVVSFLWMLKPVTKSREAGLAGAVFMMASVLYFGDPHTKYNGWQLMFTMCSYYGAYVAIAAMAFGCYLRAGQLHKKSFLVLLGITCLLSFGLGMQSLRQTAVMTCPMIAMEILRVLYCRIRKIPVDRKPMTVTAVISASNVLGLIVIRRMDTTGIGVRVDLSMPTVSELLAAIPEQLKNAYSIFAIGGRFQMVFFWLTVLLCVFAAVKIVVRFVRGQEACGAVLLILFGTGLAAVFAAGVLALLHIRMPYYFMVFPAMAFLLAYAYAYLGRWGKGAVLAVLLVMTVLVCPDYHRDVLVPVREKDGNVYEEAAEYLLENGYTTIYSEWINFGEDVAVASGCRLEVGYWTWEYAPYEPYKVLCDPGVYERPAEECAYLFRGQERVDYGVESAKARGVELTPLASFPEGDLYLFSAPVNLMSGK